MEILDKVDRPIRPGDIITFASPIGKTSHLRIGKVRRIERRERRGYPNRVTTIIIRSITDWYPYSLELMSKDAQLIDPKRIIVLEPSQVRPEWKNLLDTVEVLP